MDGLSNVLMYLNLCDEPDLKDAPSIMIRFSAFYGFAGPFVCKFADILAKIQINEFGLKIGFKTLTLANEKKTFDEQNH